MLLALVARAPPTNSRACVFLQAMVIVNKDLESDHLNHAELIRTQLGTREGEGEKEQALYRDVQVYYLDMLPDLASNDCMAVTALLDLIFQRLRLYFPTAKCVGLFSDNASGYTAAVVLLAAPFLAHAHRFVLTDLLHGEAGDCKSENDSHFGVLGWILTRGVASGRDLTTLAELYQILTLRPTRNCITSVVSCSEDVLDRLKELHDAIKLVNVGAARHVTYSKVDLESDTPVRITLWRQSRFSNPVEVPNTVVRAVYEVLSQPPFCLDTSKSTTGAVLRSSVVRSNEVDVVLERSKHWGRGAGSERAKQQLQAQQEQQGDGGGGGSSAAEEAGEGQEGDFRPVFLSGSTKPASYVCNTCFAVLFDSRACSGHVCRQAQGGLTSTVQAVRLAVESCIGGSSGVTRSLTPGAIAALVVPTTPGFRDLPVGYARRPARQDHSMPEEIKTYLTGLFYRGDSTTKAGRTQKKQSPATARQAVLDAITEGELVGVELDDVPEVPAIQSLFGSLSAKKRKAALRAFLATQSQA